MDGIGEVVVVVAPAGEAGLGNTRLLSCVNGLLPAADGIDGMDGDDAVVGIVGMDGVARLDGIVRAAGAEATVVGAESVAAGLLGMVGCPFTVGAAS